VVEIFSLRVIVVSVVVVGTLSTKVESLKFISNGKSKGNITLFKGATISFSGGRPEGSKCNLKFQSATWHHFKHFQSKDFFSCCLSFIAFELFCHNYMENP
jgi:hypothetical protein